MECEVCGNEKLVQWVQFENASGRDFELKLCVRCKFNMTRKNV